MNIYHIREFWFDDFYEGNGTIQRAFITGDGFQSAKHSRDGAIERLWTGRAISQRMITR